MRKVLLFTLMLLPFLANAQDTDPVKRTVDVGTAGTLSNSILEADKYQIEELTLTGDLNGTDFKYIRQMAGSDWVKADDGVKYSTTEGKLKKLDLSKANIVKGGDYYLISETKPAGYDGEPTDGVYEITTDDQAITYMLFAKTNLQTVILPQNVTSIGERAFEDCANLTSITIPGTVTSIGERAFYNCTGLTSVISGTEAPFDINENVFGCDDKDLYATVSLTVPFTTKSAYLSKEGWKKFQNVAEVSGVGRVFELDGICYKIGEDNVVAVTSRTEKYAGSVVIPTQVAYNNTNYSVTAIDASAFAGCSDLASITIPNSVTAIGDAAFSGCTGLSLIISNVATPFDVNDNLFGAEGKDLYNAVTVIVPVGTKESYLSKEGWKLFKKLYEVGESGQVFVVDGLSYRINDGKVAAVTAGTAKYAGDIEIPEKVTYFDITYDVTSIEDGAFSGCSEMKSILIPSSITSIGEAFEDCHSLTAVNIKNVEAWCKIVFSGNPQVSNPLYQAKHLFLNGAVVSNLQIPAGVTSVSSQAFYGCSGISSVTIPSSVVAIGRQAFHGTGWYDGQADGIVYAGDVVYTYKGTMPSNSDVVLKDGTRIIAEWAFDGCAGLTSLTLPSSLAGIGEHAFSGCNAITSIFSEIETPFELNTNVFDSNSIFETAALTVPTYKKSVYQSTAGWDQFKNITEVAPPVVEFSQDGVTYRILSTGEAQVITSSESVTGIIIPETVTYEGESYRVTSIADNAFHRNITIASVVIPNSVTYIGENAFGGCISLTSMTIPNSVTVIGPAAFYACTNLTDVTLPNNISRLTSNMFWYCTSLKSITIPASVTAIEEEVFKDCPSLKSVVTEIEHPFAISGTVFENIPADAMLTVPVGTRATYRSLPGWSQFRSILEVGSDSPEFSQDDIIYRILPSGTAEVVTATRSITNLVIPETVSDGGTLYTVTSIGEGAFHRFAEIETVELPSTITRIEKDAFGACSSLGYIIIPSSVTEIGPAAFYGCKSLASVALPSNISHLSSSLFWACTALQTIKIPASVTSIDEEAFSDCVSLISVVSEIVQPFDIPGNVFSNIPADAVLTVPSGTKYSYLSAEGWNQFEYIEEMGGESKICAKPTISYENGKLVFESDTEGVVFQSTISDDDIATYIGNEVQLSVTYRISVFAQKVGYADSEVATATLCWIDVEPKAEGITDVASVRANAVLIQSNGNEITVQGADEGTPISVYNMSGQKVASAKAVSGVTAISTTLSRGEVGIVKIGEKAVKVLVK